ncbi:hypothetical protein C1N58_19140 [Pantoea sp. SGAir0180]
MRRPWRSRPLRGILPLRPGLRSLLSAPDAGRKIPACQSWFLLKAGVVCSECVQWDSKKFL